MTQSTFCWIRRIIFHRQENSTIPTCLCLHKIKLFMLAWKVVILHGNEWIPRMKMAHFGLLLLYQGNLLLSALSGGIPSGDLSQTCFGDHSCLFYKDNNAAWGLWSSPVRRGTQLRKAGLHLPCSAWPNGISRWGSPRHMLRTEILRKAGNTLSTCI